MSTFRINTITILLVIFSAYSTTSAPEPIKSRRVTSKNVNSSKCPVELNYVIRGTDYYWQCQDGSKTFGKIAFHECRATNAAEECSKKFSTVKNPKCVKEIKSTKTFDAKTWTKMQSARNQIPGVALCSIQGKALAVEYFFEPTTSPNPVPPIHFSWKEVNPADLMLMDPLNVADPMNAVYNTKDTLQTACSIPKYGFLPKPTLIIEDSNGKWVHEDKDFFENKQFEAWNKIVNIDLKKYAPGKYRIKCVGEVWDSKETVEVGVPFEIKV